MSKKVYYILLIISLVLFSMLFVSCEAITAQNINIDSNSRLNSFPDGNVGGPNKNSTPSMNGNPRKNGAPRMNDNGGPAINGNTKNNNN